MANIINGTDTGSGGLITTGDSSDELQLQTAETARVTLTNTAVVVNEDGNDVDFRVEGDTDANLLFVDAGNDRMGIGTSSPAQKLDVVGSGLFTVSGSNQSIILNTSNNAQNYNGLINFQRQGTVKFYTALDSNDNLVFLNSSASNLLTLDSSSNLKFNSGYGSAATAYGCRAWVNFNGTGTVAIRASGNVSSITDNGTGLYTINFSSAMPDGNYAPAGLARDGSNANGQINFRYNVAPATGSLAVETVFASLFNDADYASIIVIR